MVGLAEATQPLPCPVVVEVVCGFLNVDAGFGGGLVVVEDHEPSVAVSRCQGPLAGTNTPPGWPPADLFFREAALLRAALPPGLGERHSP